MSVVLTSTTATPEEVQQALDAYGETESVETLDTEAGAPTTEETPAAETPAAETEPTETPVAETEPAGDPEADIELNDEERAAFSKAAWKKFNQVTQQRYREKQARAVAEARLTDTEKRLADLERQLNERNTAAPKPAEVEVAPPAVEVPKPEPKPKPDPANFADGVYDPAYVDALMDWRDEQREAKEAERRTALEKKITDLEAELKRAPEKTQAEVQAELDRQERLAVFNQQVDEFKKSHPDWDEVSTKTDVLVSGPLADAIQDDPDSRVRLLYWLGKNPEEAARIFEATKIDVDDKGNITSPPNVVAQRIRTAAREHARILALTEKAPEAQPVATEKPKRIDPKPKPPVSKAPQPIVPASSASAPSTGKNPYTDKMSPAEYNAWRDSQRRG